MKSVKTAVSLPAPTYRRAEALRRKAGKSRSALYAEALERYLQALEVREREEVYAAGYRKHPENAAELEAFARSASETLPSEDW